MGKKNYGKSVKTRLLNLMNETGYKYMYLLARYFNERLLYRVSVSQYKDNFLLKGGSLLYAMDGLNARPTIDVDFMAERISHDEYNSRMKDFFDCYQLLTKRELDDETLYDAIKATFHNRELEYNPKLKLFTAEFVNDSNRQMRWKLFLRKIQWKEELSFNVVMQVITDRLKPMAEKYWNK